MEKDTVAVAAEDSELDVFKDDDEFEEFEINEGWDDKEEEKETRQQWEDDWDDDDVDDDFSAYYHAASGGGIIWEEEYMSIELEIELN